MEAVVNTSLSFSYLNVTANTKLSCIHTQQEGNKIIVQEEHSDFREFTKRFFVELGGFWLASNWMIVEATPLSLGL